MLLGTESAPLQAFAFVPDPAGAPADVFGDNANAPIVYEQGVADDRFGPRPEPAKRDPGRTAFGVSRTR